MQISCQKGNKRDKDTLVMTHKTHRYFKYTCLNLAFITISLGHWTVFVQQSRGHYFFYSQFSARLHTKWISHRRRKTKSDFFSLTSSVLKSYVFFCIHRQSSLAEWWWCRWRSIHFFVQTKKNRKRQEFCELISAAAAVFLHLYE